MLRSLSRAVVVTALVAAPAGAQFGGPSLGNSEFTVPALTGQLNTGSGPAATNGLTRIDGQISPDVVVASPEPAGIVLLATGLVGVFGIARRKRNDRLS